MRSSAEDRKPMAETAACRMEHVIDSTTVDRLVCFIQYIHSCPRAGADWLESFIRFCKSDQKNRGECTECIRGLKGLGKAQKTGKPR